jgi:(p)ppGpp synthase/HD superfamily hydrolase
MTNPDLFQKALNFAAKYHKDQKIKDRDYPYLTHVFNVTMELMNAFYYKSGMDVDFAVQCALLHDVIEDTDATYNDVLKEFGQDVADGVKALSKDMSMAKEIRLKDSVMRIMKMPKEIWMVKLSDRIANLQKPPSSWDKDKIEKYHDDAVFIYESLHEADKYLADRLQQKIKEYEYYFK